jgi:hypothetical protein
MQNVPWMLEVQEIAKKGKLLESSQAQAFNII